MLLVKKHGFKMSRETRQIIKHFCDRGAVGNITLLNLIGNNQTYWSDLSAGRGLASPIWMKDCKIGLEHSLDMVLSKMNLYLYWTLAENS